MYCRLKDNKHQKDPVVVVLKITPLCQQETFATTGKEALDDIADGEDKYTYVKNIGK